MKLHVIVVQEVAAAGHPLKQGQKLKSRNMLYNKLYKLFSHQAIFLNVTLYFIIYKHEKEITSA
jgi:hypothetical protein